MGDLLYLIIGIVVLGLAVTAGLVTSGRRRRGAPPAPSNGPSAGTDIIAPPTPTTTEPALAPVTTLDRPEGTASRLVRLRQRLAVSQRGHQPPRQHVVHHQMPGGHGNAQPAHGGLQREVVVLELGPRL